GSQLEPDQLLWLPLYGKRGRAGRRDRLCVRQCAADSRRVAARARPGGLRAGCQVRSLTLTEQQPEVNIIRIAYEALPVTLCADARVNALQLPGFREAL